MGVVGGGGSVVVRGRCWRRGRSEMGSIRMYWGGMGRLHAHGCITDSIGCALLCC